MPRRRILREYRVDRVDIVRRGANRKRFHLFKEEVDMPDEYTEEEVEQMVEVITKAPEGFDEDAMLVGIEKIEKSTLSPEARKAVCGTVRLLDATKDALPKGIKRMLNSLQGLVKSTNGKKTDYDEIANPTKPVKPKVRKDDGNVDPALLDEVVADLVKDDALSPEVRELLNTVVGSNRELRKDVSLERDARLKKDYEVKAGEFESLPLSKEDLASVLMWLSKDAEGDNTDPVEKILGLFAGCNEIIKEAEITKELLHVIPGDDADPNTPIILKKATEGEESLIAFVKANPREYDNYLRDQRKRTRGL